MTLTNAEVRASFAKASLVYALLIAYVSLALGPGGFNFHPIDASTAWHRFLATRFDVHDPLFSSDWNSNLLMFVPLGIFITGTLWPLQSNKLRWFVPILASIFSLLFLLFIKFLQLYVPPRTVSINYIMAQSFGAVIGVALFVSLNRPLSQLPRHPRGVLTAVLGFYAVAFFAFLLFPFDLILNPGALHERLEHLPRLLLALPGSGRSLPWRGVFLVIGTAETVPLGFLLTLTGRRRSILCVAAMGFAAMTTISLLQVLVASSAPSGLAILFRTFGIVIGAVVGFSIGSLDLGRLRQNLPRTVPFFALIYLIALLLMNDVVSLHWRSTAQAWAALDPRGLLPFWHAYIVSKSQALRSVVAHVVMYAPIGVMIWIRRGERPGGSGLALALAAALASAVEVARWFRPDLQPDFSNTLIAAAAAAFAVPFSAMAWGLIEQSFSAGNTGHLTASSVNVVTAVGPQNISSGTTPSRRGRASFWLMRFPLSAACAALTAVILSYYPLPPWPLAFAAIFYAVALSRWPVIWLVVVPMILPALDLAPWTGWLYLGESDLFIAVTIAVLLVMRPSANAQLPISKFALAALLLSCVTYATSVAVGLWVVPALPTDNPYLSAWNGLRLAKGFLLALALFPFLKREIQLRANALVWLGIGVVGGLLLVASATIAERLVFVSLLDFSTDYRVTATFSSMHLGGGHIGVFLAMAIPFLSLCALKRREGIIVGMILSVVASYTLVVTYARSAYAAAIIAILVLGFGWAVATRRARQRLSNPITPVFSGLVVVILISALGVGSHFMRERFDVATMDADLSTREANWASGLNVMNPGFAAKFIGMGLGTFPRIYRARAVDEPIPTDFVVRHDDERSWLVIKPGASSFYFGQKVAATETGPYTLTFDLRVPDGHGVVNVSLCEKLLLYSDNCRGTGFAVTTDQWEQKSTILQVDELAQPVLFRWMRRPVELAFQAATLNTPVEITAVRLLDPQKNDLIHNGSFAQEAERWYFTSDDHLVWRMKNQFLMLWFEQGALGLISYIFLCVAALLGLWRAISDGNRAAAPFAAAIIAYFCCGFFDFLLEAPRLSTLFYLFCFTGLAMPEWAGRTRSPTLPR